MAALKAVSSARTVRSVMDGRLFLTFIFIFTLELRIKVFQNEVQHGLVCTVQAVHGIREKHGETTFVSLSVSRDFVRAFNKAIRMRSFAVYIGFMYKIKSSSVNTLPTITG